MQRIDPNLTIFTRILPKNGERWTTQFQQQNIKILKYAHVVITSIHKDKKIITKKKGQKKII